MFVFIANTHATMKHVLFRQPVANTSFGQQINGALLQNTGPNTLLNIVAAPRFQNDTLNATETKDPGQ